MSIQDSESLLPSLLLGKEQLFGMDSEISHAEDLLFRLTGKLTEKNWVVAGSPESILGGTRSWSFSSNGSSDTELSTPTTPSGAIIDNIWDPFCTAAGHIARLKINNQINKNIDYQEKGLLVHARIRNLDPVVKNQSIDYNCWQLNQNQTSQCSSVWGKQQVKATTGCSWQVPAKPHQQHRQIQSRGRRDGSIVGYNSGKSARPLGLPQSAWPPLQVNKHHQPSRQLAAGSESGAKRECAGTGVFLPRRYGSNNPDQNKKPGMASFQHPALDYDNLMKKRSEILGQQKENLHADQCVVINHEIQLPQEWIY